MTLQEWTKAQHRTSYYFVFDWMTKPKSVLFSVWKALLVLKSMVLFRCGLWQRNQINLSLFKYVISLHLFGSCAILTHPKQKILCLLFIYILEQWALQHFDSQFWIWWKPKYICKRKRSFGFPNGLSGAVNRIMSIKSIKSRQSVANPNSIKILLFAHLFTACTTTIWYKNIK